MKVGAGAFVRPRFFAGQLLTEEDLEQLTTYVTAKNRLHNRFLKGAGVVCGLEVLCDPCGGGTVTVQPGYALDCCGNDIVVPCPEEVDILEMIRELRISAAGGRDCGDPCADGPKGGADDDCRQYWLYVNYAEQHTDPVAPYATDEPCGPERCEASRVREGFRFTLRHERCDGRNGPDGEDRFFECLGDDTSLMEHAGKSRWLRLFSRGLRRAIEIEDVPAPQEEEWQRVTEELRSLAEHEGTLAEDDDSARQVLDDLTRKASAIAHAKSLDSDARARANVPSQLEDLSTLLTTVAGMLAEQRTPQLLASWAQPYGEATIRAARWVGEHDANQPFPQDAAARAILAGVAVDGALFDRMSRDLRAQKEWLLDRLDSATWVTDCSLRDDVAAINVAARPTAAETAGSGSELPAFDHTAHALARATLRYWMECLCRALNPPCPPCDDEAVLLARIEVCDCEVVDICLAVRDYVLSGPALRYWLPPLRHLRDAVESLCCGDECEPDEDSGEREEPAGILGRDHVASEAESPRRRALFSIRAELEDLAPERAGVLNLPTLGHVIGAEPEVKAIGRVGLERLVADRERARAEAAEAEVLRRIDETQQRLEAMANDLSRAVEDRVGGAISGAVAPVRNEIRRSVARVQNMEKELAEKLRAVEARVVAFERQGPGPEAGGGEGR